jgi:hypothetical protein
MYGLPDELKTPFNKSVMDRDDEPLALGNVLVT